MADNSWIDDVPVDNTALAEVKRAVDKWNQLRFACEKAEMEYTEAKNRLDEYASTVVAILFRKNGLESLKLDNGSTVSVVRGVRASVKKDEASKKVVAQWLKEHDMEQLVSEQYIVLNREQLDKYGIAYDADISMNTNSIKAYVRGEMEKGNLGLGDLPKGLSWFEYDEIRVSTD